VATNSRSYFIPVNRDNTHNDSQHHKSNGRYHHGITSAHDRHSHRGSHWTNSEAACRFRAQLAQFDTGTISFRACIPPSASQLITAIHKESPSAQLCQNCSQLAASAYQISLHEQHAQIRYLGRLKISSASLHMGRHHRKSQTIDNCIRVMMENFNSLGIFTKGTKINSLN
jgi:hypothetical protein